MKHVLWGMFSNLQNAQMAKKKVTFQKRKKICESFLNILWDEGFISGYVIDKKNDKLKIFLKYHQSKPAIKKIKINLCCDVLVNIKFNINKNNKIKNYTNYHKNKTKLKLLNYNFYGKSKF